MLDIKPYVPYADAFPDARAGWLEASVQDEPDQSARAEAPDRCLRDMSVGDVPENIDVENVGDMIGESLWRGATAYGRAPLRP